MVLFPWPPDIELLSDAPDCGVFVLAPPTTGAKLVVAARDNGDWIALFVGAMPVVGASIHVSISNLILLSQNLPDRPAETAKEGFAIEVREAVRIDVSSSNEDGAASDVPETLGAIAEGS